MMRKEIEQWWNTFIPHIGMTPLEFMQRMGDKDFDVRSYVTDSYAEPIKTFIESSMIYGDDNSPERTEYWKERGIERVVYGDPEDLTSRTVYYPSGIRGSDGKHPLIVCVYNAGSTMLSLESLGFVHIAAHSGFIVLVPKDGNSDEHVLRAVEETAAAYPVDRERIFIAGHSFGGATAGWQAVRHPDVYAGACILGFTYGCTDNTEEEIQNAKELRLPMINICGTREVSRALPLNVDIPEFVVPPKVADNVTPLPHMKDICLNGVQNWRRINGTKEYSMEEDCSDTLSIPEMAFGLHADQSETRDYLGRKHYVCDMLGEEGLPIIRWVAVEDCPHTIPPTAADLAWEFFRDIRRDAVTKEIRYDVPEPFWKSIRAEVRYDRIGPKYTEFMIRLKEGSGRIPVSAEDFSISGFSDMTPVRYQFKALRVESVSEKEMRLMVPAVSADRYVPVYGGRGYRGEIRVRCLVPGYEFTASDITGTELPQTKRYQNGYYTGSTGITIPYCYYQAESREKLPLIVYATGCLGDNNEDDNEQILGPGPLKMASEEFQSRFPCHVMAPWYPLGGHPEQGEAGQRMLEDYSRNLTELVENVIRELGADVSRVYFIGNGGGAIYQSLSLGEHIYAAAAMLTTIFDFFNDGSEMKYLDNLSGMPIYITHASSDMPCPVKRSRMSYSRLKELGNRELYYHEYTDRELADFGIDTDNEVGSHYSALVDYAGDDMFRWLFSYRRKLS
jgi:Predicted peptidase